MECLHTKYENNSIEENTENEILAKQSQWIFLVKKYIMSSKCANYSSISISCLTNISRKIILISILLLALITYCRQFVVYQDSKNCRLFPQDSIVKDFIHGESDLLYADIINSDLSFVVYYAPWDYDSNKFKSIFYEAAVQFHEQINFASINCWYPEGKCRKQEDLMKYPTVMLHARLPSNKQAISIKYTGPLLLSHVNRFLERALKPITYVATLTELDELELLYQVIVLGCFTNTVPSNFDYFYYASLISLQFSYATDVTYAATYNSTLCGGISNIKLINWNGTINFPTESLYQTKEIIQFLQKNIFVMPTWVPIHEYRSEFLSNTASEGPLMVVFVPDDYNYILNDDYLMLRSVALDYFNCKNDSKINIQIERLLSLAAEKSSYVKHLCVNYSRESSSNKHIYTDSWCKHSILNSSNQCNMYGNSEYCLIDEESTKDIYSILRNIENYSHSQVKLNKTHQSSNACNSSLPTSFSGPLKDENVEKVKEWFMDKQCKKYLVNKTTVKTINPIKFGVISGMGCSSNNTLNIVAIDSVQKSDFIYNNNKSNVWIIDSSNEELYYLESTLTRENLVSFIYNYSNGLLYRNLFTTQSSPEIKNISNVSSDRFPIVEMNAINYINKTQEIGRSFVILHYSSYCGACKAVGQTFLECAKLFENVHEITFGRINVSNNYLPWHFTFTQVPQIIFHPSKRKADTEVFDSSLEINTRSLFLFIISKLDSDTRKRVAHHLKKNLIHQT